MALTIISINVNGLRGPSKRAGFLHWLHSLPCIPDIVCLQEAHCMSSEECSSWFSSSGLSFVVYLLWCSGLPAITLRTMFLRGIIFLVTSLLVLILQFLLLLSGILILCLIVLLIVWALWSVTFLAKVQLLLVVFSVMYVVLTFGGISIRLLPASHGQRRMALYPHVLI